MRRGRRHSAAEGAVFGVAVMALGILILLAQQGLIARPWGYAWWEFWPAILIAFGAVRLVRPVEARDVGGGVTMILFGLWFFANIFEWYGLGWYNSWPLALVVIGAGMIARAIATAVMRPNSKEESHG